MFIVSMLFRQWSTITLKSFYGSICGVATSALRDLHPTPCSCRTCQRLCLTVFTPLRTMFPPTWKGVHRARDYRRSAGGCIAFGDRRPVHHTGTLSGGILSPHRIGVPELSPAISCLHAETILFLKFIPETLYLAP